MSPTLYYLSLVGNLLRD